MTEFALTTAVCPPTVTLAQLDRLTSVIGLPDVRFGVLPNYQLPHLLPTGFWIVDTEVFVEHASIELRIDDPDQVAIYTRLTDRLWTVAAEVQVARTILDNCQHRWTDRRTNRRQHDTVASVGDARDSLACGDAYAASIGTAAHPERPIRDPPHACGDDAYSSA